MNEYSYSTPREGWEKDLTVSMKGEESARLVKTRLRTSRCYETSDALVCNNCLVAQCDAAKDILSKL